MTRKDYKLIAAALQHLRPTGTGPRNEGARLMWADIRDDLAHVFAADNAAFDAAKFREACDA